MAGKGAPKGNQFALKHGIVQVRAGINRRVKRNRNYVDERTHEGQEALRIQAGLIDDQGGVEAITATQFIAIQELTQHYYLVSLIDRSIATYLRKNPQAKESAKMLARVFAYRTPVSSSLARYLDIIGLDKKAAPVKTLDEILAQPEQPEPPKESE